MHDCKEGFSWCSLEDMYILYVKAMYTCSNIWNNADLCWLRISCQQLLIIKIRLSRKMKLLLLQAGIVADINCHLRNRQNLFTIWHVRYPSNVYFLIILQALGSQRWDKMNRFIFFTSKGSTIVLWCSLSRREASWVQRRCAYLFWTLITCRGLY